MTWKTSVQLNNILIWFLMQRSSLRYLLTGMEPQWKHT